MNNNVNQPDKDIEQLITETLDRCMSGIDTAPSLRPAVDKKLEENPRPEKRHIPVRRFAVPAVALALCVCLIVTGTHFGMFRWPDRIRTPETKVTVQPVPLAQPEGESGEGSPAQDGTAQPESAGEPGWKPGSPTETFRSLLEEMTPVNAVYEKFGIRFEVHSAEVYETHTRVLCSLQDMEGSRTLAGNPEFYPDFTHSIAGPSMTIFLNYGWIPEEHRAWYYMDFLYDGIGDRSDHAVEITASNVPLMRESGELAGRAWGPWSVYLPLKSILKDTADYPEKYSEEFFASRLSYIVNEDGTATVVGPESENSPFFWTRLVIPEKLDGRYVTAVADGAFEGCFSLETVTLPDCITFIGAGAFRGCGNLHDVNFPDYRDLEFIGDEAFRDTNLQLAVLPVTLSYIGENAFESNSPLVCVVIEGSYAEEYCKKNSIPYRTWVTGTSTQPEGKGGEGVPITLSSALSSAEEDEYDERTIAVFTVLDQFCMAWEQKDPEQMAALCGCVPGDESDAAVRAADTVRTLVGAISPRGRFYEDALELVIPEDDTPVTVSVVVTDIPRQAKYRFAICLLRQPDESWLIDPASLEKCEELEYIGKNVIAVREFRDLMAIAAGSEIAGLTQLLDKHARPDDIDDILMPVNAVCEKDGIRFEVVAAAADEEQFWVLYTLQDTESDRITRYTWYPHLEQDIGPSFYMGYLDNAYIVQDHCQVFLGEHRFDNRIDLSEDRPVTFSVPFFSLVNNPAQSMADALNGPWEVQVPLSSIRIPDLSGAAQWNGWGVTPMPPVESIQAGIPDPTVAAESAQWDSWGVTPMPPVESIQADIPDPTTSEDSAQWDSWGTMAVPSAVPEEPWRIWMAESEHPEKADTLRPVGLSCDSEGIRFTVEAASVDDESIDLLYSLEDLEGNRISEETHVWGAVEVMCDGAGTAELRTNGGILYTPGRMSARLSHFVTDGTVLPGNNQPVTFFLDDLGLLSHTVLDLAPYLAEYGDSAKAMDLDESLPNQSVYWADYVKHSSETLPSRILDVSRPLDISLNPNIRLDGIGIIDGQYHVRLRYVDNEPFAEASGPHRFRPVDAALFLSFIPTDEHPSYDPCRDVCIVNWYENEGTEPNEQEFIFSLDNGAEIPLYIRSCSGIVDGNWKVEVPFDSIWTGPEDYAGSDTPGYYESRLTYTLNEDGTAAVRGIEGNVGRVTRHMVIPAELDGHPVTSVADSAFQYWGMLESVILPDTVTSIGASAFSCCIRLTSISLPEGLQSIGEEAFFSANLQAVTIPDSVTSIGRYAFMFNPDVSFEIPQNRDLIRYCRENGIPFTIRDSEPAAEPAK